MADKIVEVANEVFLAELSELLAARKQVRFAVRGRSMRPMLEHERDSVVLEQQALADYQRGDVVLALTTTGYWVLHRIVHCEGDTACVLQGDGNVGLQERCLRQDILGRVVQFTRKSHTYAVEHWLWRLYKCLWMHTVFLRRPLLLAYELRTRASGWCSMTTNAH